MGQQVRDLPPTNDDYLTKLMVDIFGSQMTVKHVWVNVSV